MSLQAKTRLEILKAIKKRVVAHHINVAAIDYQDWLRQLDERTDRLVAADEEEFESGVRELLSDLKSSHTAFYHECPTRFPSQHTIGATFRVGGEDGRRRWMFLDVFPEGPAHIAGIRPGNILEEVDGVAQTPETAPTFAIGRTHALSIARQGTQGALRVDVVVPQRKGTKQRPPIVEPKSISHRIIEPGVGLLQVLYFSGVMGMRFTKEMDRTIELLKEQHCDRLIIDLRGNVGGSLGFARLASYLGPEQTPIGYSLTPKRLRTGYVPAELPRVPMPANRVSLMATLARFSFRDKSVMLMTQGLGSQPFHNRTVVLVNQWTTSAGEMAAAFAKENRFGIVVGETSRGNVLGAVNFDVGGGYWLRLPVFGWFTANGLSLEGTGVTPDVPLQIDGDALASGEDNQMSKAIEIARTF